MEKLERVTAALDEWKPEVEGTMDDIRIEVGKLSKHWERAVRARSPPLLPTAPPFSTLPPSTPRQLLLTSSAQVLPQPTGDPKHHPLEDLLLGSASGRPPASDQADRPHGHCLDNFNREDGYGSVTTLVHPPVKGVCRLPTPPKLGAPQLPRTEIPLHRSSNQWRSVNSGSSSMGRLPKLNFPVFDGDNPKLWLSRATDYFDLYEVEHHRWIIVASMHFVAPTSRWLQSVQHKIKSCSWKTFADMVLDRFGRDQHELLIRQLFHIKQSSSVADYVDRFAELVDQLASYENNPDPLHFTMRFIDGLREELRAPVLIQLPTDLDTAYVLAKLQEEVAVPGRRREFKKNDYGFPHKQDVPPSSLLPAAGKLNRTVMASPETSKPRSVSDRWSSLKAYRRAQGLCQHCAEKWTKDHKCSDKIQLHVLQEVLEVFEDMETSDIEQNCMWGILRISSFVLSL
jgi:hypothetical protein